jgi:carbamoylphosphate synthase large subunit
MDKITDIHVESARIQHEIEKHLGIEGNLVFDFMVQEGKTKLNLITINRRHNQSFLFHSELGVDRVDALGKMLDYARNYMDRESSYTIQWVPTGSRELQTSYFRARNVYEALDKLYYGREINSITVFSVVLNPVA